MRSIKRTTYRQFRATAEHTGKTYFSIQDLELFYSYSRASLRVLLSQWAQEQLIIRLARGMYTFDPARVDYEQLATTLHSNAYISFEYALHYYGLIDQVPSTITLATSGRSRRLHLSQWEFEYTHLKPSLMFGYVLKDRTLIASAEKALADILYVMTRGQRIVELDTLNKKKIDAKVLARVLKDYPSSVQVHARKRRLIQ